MNQPCQFAYQILNFAHSHIHKKLSFINFNNQIRQSNLENSFFLWDVLQFIRHSTSGAGKRKYYYSNKNTIR